MNAFSFAPNPTSTGGGMVQSGNGLPSNYWEELLFFLQLVDSKSPHCRFKKYLYNLVNPKEVHLYGKAPNESEELYQQAVLNNEDPSCLIPVLVSGPGELKRRLETALRESHQHADLLKALRSSLVDLQTKHANFNAQRVADCKKRQQIIAHRILKVIRQYHVLRNQNHVLKPEEETLKQQFDNLITQIKRPALLTGKLLELKARLEQIKQVADWQQNELQEGTSASVFNTIQNLDSETKERLFKLLLENHSSIADALALLEEDSRTLKELGLQYRHIEKQSVTLQGL